MLPLRGAIFVFPLLNPKISYLCVILSTIFEIFSVLYAKINTAKKHEECK